VILWAVLAAGCGGQEPYVESLRLPGDAAAGMQRADPALALDPATGDLLMTWSAGDSSAYGIYFARSRDGGSTWSAPATVAAPARDIHPHAESAPRLVATRAGVVAVVWSNSIPAPGRRWPASNIRFARSNDGGRSWSAPLTLNDDSSGTPGGHLFHGAAWQGESTLVVTWMDERQSAAAPAHRQQAPAVVGHEHAAADAEPDARVWLARSDDLGASWAPANVPLWTEACPCCRIALARGPGGAVMAGWRRHYPGNVRDVVVAPLQAQADSLPEPQRVHPDQWVYPGCPHTGPSVALDSAGITHVAWFSGKQGAAGVYYAREEAAGGRRQFSAPIALVQARTLPASHAAVAPRPGGGAWVAWDMAADGRRIPSLAMIDGAGGLVWQVPLDSLDGADHPQVVTLPDGAAVVAWARTGAHAGVSLVRVKE
jgi:hypothetical protein